MRPLFPDINNLEEIQVPITARKRYKIMPGCQYLQAYQQNTGNSIVDGDRYKVPTDAGNLAVVWVANDQSIAENLKYFCHGHSFGTYEEFGYSLEEVGRADDEWNRVGEDKKVERTFFGDGVALEMDGDTHKKLREARNDGRSIVAIGLKSVGALDHISLSWNSGELKSAIPEQIIHSFRIRTVSEFAKDILKSSVSSKNTFGHFEHYTTIEAQLKMYQGIGALRFLVSKLPVGFGQRQPRPYSMPGDGRKESIY